MSEREKEAFADVLADVVVMHLAENIFKKGGVCHG